MNYLRDRKNRLAVSVLAAVLAAFLTVSAPGRGGEPRVLAWWGTLYPEFCFSKGEELEEVEMDGHEDQGRRVKISFWLAKALNW